MKNSGITLIALVITIIILLILAGVTMSLTLGENGLLRRTEESKIAHEQGARNDIEFMNNAYDYMEPYFNESSNIEEVHTVIVNAPKNSTTIFKIEDEEVGRIELSNEEENGNIDINKKIGTVINAECILNEEVIYEKTFELKDNAIIKMHPCAENEDGKALYWYGMEFTEFEQGQVKHDTLIFRVGSCSKNDNNINLYFNDTYYAEGVGIGICCKENLSDYNSIKVDVKVISSSGNVDSRYFVGSVKNDYKYIETGIYEGAKLIEGQKDIDIKDIQGDKYISIIVYNPAGTGTMAYGSASVNIETVVLQ